MKATQEVPESLRERLTQAILDVIGVVPTTGEVVDDSPDARAKAIARRAAATAAGISGSTALVPGPLGLLTLVPDLLGVWRVQAQMVADIAGTYGKSARLTEEQMVYCLFKHMLSQGLRDIVVRVGERYLVRRATLRLIQNLAKLIGVSMSQRLVGKAAARWLPGLGAACVAGYAYYDTRMVAQTAVELFSADITLGGTADIEDVEVKPARGPNPQLTAAEQH
ncbi:MAG: hypothetical protein ABI409_11955 [Ramlibacter sp.]